MFWHRFLIVVLAVSLFLECLWPLGGFLAPITLLGAFKLAVSADTLFLVFVLSWCLLLAAVVCGVTLRAVWRGEAYGWLLSYVLGFWWVGIGSSLFFDYGKVENLVLDALKGALICLGAWKSRHSAK